MTMARKAIVDGFEIGEEAVKFELDRLVRFYANHGMSADEVRKCLPELEEKALDQAIGARLLLVRAMQLDMPVSAADIDAEVSKVVTQIGGPDNYKKALEAQGLSEEAFRAELAKGAKVNKLVAQACSSVSDPTDEEVAKFYDAYKAEYGGKTLVDVHDQIKDLLRHEARGRAMDAFVADLKANAKIEYMEAECHCGCGHHHHH